MHEDNRVELALEPYLEEQGNVGHDNGGAVRASILERRGPPPLDFRVDDGFKVGARARIAKHDLPEGRAIERAVVCHDRRAKSHDNQVEARRSGGHRVTRVRVGIEHRRAKRGQPPGYRAFAAGDVARESDVEHAERGGSNVS